MGKDPGYHVHAECEDRVCSLVSHLTGVSETEISYHCAHAQGLLTAKVEHWMNGALKD